MLLKPDCCAAEKRKRRCEIVDYPLTRVLRLGFPLKTQDAKTACGWRWMEMMSTGMDDIGLQRHPGNIMVLISFGLLLSLLLLLLLLLLCIGVYARIGHLVLLYLHYSIVMPSCTCKTSTNLSLCRVEGMCDVYNLLVLPLHLDRTPSRQAYISSLLSPPSLSFKSSSSNSAALNRHLKTDYWIQNHANPSHPLTPYREALDESSKPYISLDLLLSICVVAR